MKILLVEDEPKVAEFIKKGLREQNHTVELAYDGHYGEKLALENEYDLIILDVILPYTGGLDVCKRIKKFKADIPILMLTALGTIQDKLNGFNSGADDYLVKPFHFEELLARISALGRRKQLSFPGNIFKAGDLELDSYKKTVKRAGTEIILTAREFSLLELLLVNKNRVLSRSYIAESVWGIDFDRGTNSIDVYINYLRKKIDVGFKDKLVHTVIGMGYVLKEP
jgi:two-component system, OmpR family, copper resistance phosphate regulon response regulator CusR